MIARAYYNEIDKHAAAWLRELIRRDLIAQGDVDDRSIVDVRPRDIDGYTECHFFAGIGGWSCALRIAGWPDDRPVWTGSCPCQPFSTAGKLRGIDDERHLWPEFFRLVRECRPGTIFGEQVAGAGGAAWWDHVAADLEAAGYAAAAANLGAHSVGAPHIRQRLYWVAHAVRGGAEHAPGQSVGAEATAHGPDGRVSRERLRAGLEGATGRMAHASEAGLGLERIGGILDGQRQAQRHDADGCGAVPWRKLEWLSCSDGKARPTQPGIFPMVARLPEGVVRGGGSGSPFDADATPEARVMRLRGYGNSIVPQVAAKFVEANFVY